MDLHRLVSLWLEVPTVRQQTSLGSPTLWAIWLGSPGGQQLDGGECQEDESVGNLVWTSENEKMMVISVYPGFDPQYYIIPFNYSRLGR